MLTINLYSYLIGAVLLFSAIDLGTSQLNEDFLQVVEESKTFLIERCNNKKNFPKAVESNSHFLFISLGCTSRRDASKWATIRSSIRWRRWAIRKWTSSKEHVIQTWISDASWPTNSLWWEDAPRGYLTEEHYISNLNYQKAFKSVWTLSWSSKEWLPAQSRLFRKARKWVPQTISQKSLQLEVQIYIVIKKFVYSNYHILYLTFLPPYFTNGNLDEHIDTSKIKYW